MQMLLEFGAISFFSIHSCPLVFIRGSVFIFLFSFGLE